jgi:hypothetical protein
MHARTGNAENDSPLLDKEFVQGSIEQEQHKNGG